jgi:hypothetical protein
MLSLLRRWLDRRRCKKMGLKGLSVGTRMDGTVDVDLHRDEDDGGWNANNLCLEEAEFLRDELTRAIERQRERGFPKAEAPALPGSTPS